MSALSDSIEQFIIAMMVDSGAAELQRNKLAGEFGCAPSQINYVLSTRFTVQRGYVVESKRGGGGYIKVLRIPANCDKLLMSAAEMDCDGSLTQGAAIDSIKRLYECGAIGRVPTELMMAALSDEALAGIPRQLRNEVRASIFSSMAKVLTMVEEDDNEV